LIDSAVRS